MGYKIAVLSGDGIGPEIVREARKVMEKLSESESFSLDFQEELFGGAAIQSESLFRRRLLRLVKIVMRY